MTSTIFFQTRPWWESVVAMVQAPVCISAQSTEEVADEEGSGRTVLVVVAMGALPGIARAAVISTWPLATNANDTTDGNNGAVQNVVFDGSDATFNGINTRVTVPFVANLVPGSGLAGLETVACSETSRWLCR